MVYNNEWVNASLNVYDHDVYTRIVIKLNVSRYIYTQYLEGVYHPNIKL
jgi:hypothetical protein